MTKLVYLASARNDLIEILTYIAKETGSVTIGRDFVDQLRHRCHELADLPGMLGRLRPELRPDIRSTVFKGYVVFFRYVDDRFEVVNILESHRDIEAHLFESTYTTCPRPLREREGPALAGG